MTKKKADENVEEESPKDPPKEPPKETGKEPPKENPPPVQVVQSLTYCPWGDGYAGGPDHIRGHILGAHMKGEPSGTPTQPALQPVTAASAPLPQPPGPGAVAPLFTGAQSPLEQRLTDVLDGLRVQADARTFVLSYWRGVADIQNPWGLYDLLMKTTGIGATNAKLATDFVFAAGGATQFANPFLPVKGAAVTHDEEPADPYDKWVDRMFTRVDREMKYRQVQKMMKDMGMAGPGESGRADRPPLSSEEEAQEMVRGMMSSVNAAMRTRVMLQAFGPVLSPQAQIQDMVPRPRIGSDGKPVLDEQGTPLVDWVPMSPRGQQVADMMQRFDRGESVDPMKLATAMMDIFTKGVQFGGGERKGEGVPTQQLLDMQARIHESQIDTLKAQFGSTEKVFEQEREILKQQFEAMAPERQIEQIEKWKKLGLLGGDNLEAIKLQLRMRMWETERSDAKDQQMAQAQAQMAESERARQQFHDLIDLGKNALTDALKPVTMAIGDGIRQRVAGAPPPAPGAPPPPGTQSPPDYASMSPEQRAEYRAKLDEIQQKVNAERARLDAGGG